MSPEQQATEVACEAGHQIVDPSAVQRAVLEALAAGPATVRIESVFPCFDAVVDGHRSDRGCSAWIVVRPETDAVWCPSCGREHVEEEERPHRARYTVSLPEHRVEQWIADELGRLDLPVTRLRDGVAWRVGDEAVVVWLERSEGTRWVTRASVASRPTVFLLSQPRRWASHIPAGVRTVALGTWVAHGPAAIVEALDQAELPTFAHDVVAPVWEAGRAAPPAVVVRRVGVPELVVAAEHATVDGVVVVQAPGSMLDVLRVLTERWLDDHAAGLAPDAHRPMTVDELRKRLRVKSDAAGRAVRRLRETIRDRLREALLDDPGDDVVVENLPMLGYRLQPRLLPRITADTPEKVRTPPPDERTPKVRKRSPRSPPSALATSG